MSEVAIATTVSHDDYGSIVLPSETYPRRVRIFLDGEYGRFRVSFTSPPSMGVLLDAKRAPMEFILPAGQPIYLYAQETWGDTAVVDILATPLSLEFGVTTP